MWGSHPHKNPLISRELAWNQQTIKSSSLVILVEVTSLWWSSVKLIKIDLFCLALAKHSTWFHISSLRSMVSTNVSGSRFNLKTPMRLGGCATCCRQRWYAMRYQWHLGIADNEGCLFSPSCLGTLGSTFGPKKLGHVVPNLAVLTFYPQTCGISLALHWPLVSASPSAGALWRRWLVCHPHVPCNKSLHIHMPGDVWGQYLH